MITIPFSENIGLTFRQWRAESHCRFLHHYKVRLDLGVDRLEDRSLEFIRSLRDSLLVAKDDPMAEMLLSLEGFSRHFLLDAVGCEKTSEWIHQNISLVQPISYVKTWEHMGNFGAFYAMDQG